VRDLDIDDLTAAAAYMRQLNGPAAEPLARLFDTLAAGAAPDVLSSAVLTAARAVVGRTPHTCTPPAATESL